MVWSGGSASLLSADGGPQALFLLCFSTNHLAPQTVTLPEVLELVGAAQGVLLIQLTTIWSRRVNLATGGRTVRRKRDLMSPPDKNLGLAPRRTADLAKNLRLG